MLGEVASPPATAPSPVLFKLNVLERLALPTLLSKTSGHTSILPFGTLLAGQTLLLTFSTPGWSWTPGSGDSEHASLSRLCLFITGLGMLPAACCPSRLWFLESKHSPRSASYR